MMKDLVLLGDHNPNFVTHRELDAALQFLPSTIRAHWVGTDAPDWRRAVEADGLWVVPGSPYRNDDVVYSAIEAARISGQPFLGTCGGFQYAVLEFARHVAGLEDAGHGETEPGAARLVVERLACGLIAQERMVTPVRGTRLDEWCGSTPFVGFHCCNFGLSAVFVDTLVQHGMVVGARADDAGVEAVELPTHPFFLATLFQPQVGTTARGKLHPVLDAFVSAVSGQ
jgi:CTP synthase (UTP-ammonia lyase)